jgi:diacylglycerol kinase family enzyme
MEARNGDLVHLQMDGEYAGRLPARVTISPDAVTLLVPASYGK